MVKSLAGLGVVEGEGGLFALFGKADVSEVESSEEKEADEDDGEECD